MTEFLWSLLFVSMSVSALLLALRLLRAPLLARYRARTLYLVTLGVLLLLLFPSRPSLVPRAAWEAVPIPAAPRNTMQLPAAPISPPEGQELPAAEAHGSALAAEAATTLGKHAPIRWDLWIGALWLAGALGMLALRIARHARFLRLLRRWRAPLSPAYQAELTAQCARLGMRAPRGACTPLVRTPTVIGLLRPRLLQPEGVAKPEQLPLVLRHELCHLRRGDLWGKALIDLICAAHWFNPLMLLFRRDAALLCEMACDEAVLAREGEENRGAYLSAVVAALCAPDRSITSLSTQFGGGMKRMKQRLALLCDGAPRRRGVGLIAAVLALALCTGGALAAVSATSTPGATIGPRMPLTGDAEFDRSRMPQEDYDFVMGFQAQMPNDMTLDESHALLQPHAARLREIFDRYIQENWFMEHLQYDLTEMRNLRATRCVYGAGATAAEWEHEGLDRFFRQDCLLMWQSDDPSKTTVGERNRAIDAIQARVRIYLMEGTWAEEGQERAARLAFKERLEKEYSSETLDVMIVLRAPELIEWEDALGGVTKDDYERLMTLYQPGYSKQTVAEFDASLWPMRWELRQIYDRGMFAPHGFYRAVRNSLKGMYGKAEAGWSDSLWGFGDPYLAYTLRWEVLAPDRLTVAERDAALDAAMDRLRIAGLGLDCTTLSAEEMTAQIAPQAQAIARELSSDTLRIELADVRFV